MTDNYPQETSWTLTNVNTNDVVISVPTYTYSTKLFLYKENYYIGDNQCYQFTIFDSARDGLCCGYGVGYYKIFYEGQLLLEGADFVYTETSILFGNGCPNG
jgi:lysyl endopeptidase